MPGTLTLDSVSVLLVWTAIAIYALAFIAYAVDLARRGARAVDAQDAVTRERELVSVAAAGQAAEAPPTASPGRDANARLRDQERAAEAAFEARPSDRPRLIWARIGTSLTVLAFLFHVAGDVTRGIAAGRVPWSNMYEFALTGTMLIVAVYLVSLLRYDLRFLGAFITGLVVLLLGGAALAFYVEISPLMDPLKSVWLVIHVFVASLATALFALAFGLSVLQLMQARRERRTAALAMPRVTPSPPPRPVPASCARCPAAMRSSRSRTGSRSSASSSGPSPSSPAPSGRTTHGVATGASTRRRSGPSSSGCCTRGTSTRAPRAAGAGRGRRGSRSSASAR